MTSSFRQSMPLRNPSPRAEDASYSQFVPLCAFQCLLHHQARQSAVDVFSNASLCFAIPRFLVTAHARTDPSSLRKLEAAFEHDKTAFWERTDVYHFVFQVCQPSTSTSRVQSYPLCLSLDSIKHLVAPCLVLSADRLPVLVER